jgi:serine/threonine protein kinase
VAFPDVGDNLDIFILGSRLHTGPLADIFLAEDLLSRQRVVLKIPGTDILNHPVLLYHYQNEDRISRRLDHPGIIGFIQRQKSRQYIIMEYAEGKDLRSLIGKNHALALPAALQLMQQLADTVSYLHGQGIVHLDLKPENIICNRDNAIKLLDFGLASCRHLPDLPALDLKNPLGTPWYIAPEQLLGERADPRCDIYAMGMLFYEMLTGRLPWPRSSKLGIARRRLRQAPTPPRYYNNNIPARIQSIILRAIARHADDRYPDIAELQHDLQHWRQLPVTETGRSDKRPSLWQRLFPGKAVRLNKAPQKKTRSYTSNRVQIIGALIDSPGSADMLAEIKKQALIRSADITLVHVIEEESDSHFRRYGITVEGEKLMERLEQAVQLLRRCNLDPSIRLIRGEVVEVLRELCTDLDADLLVLAGSRKKEGILRSASVRRRLADNRPCPIIVADAPPFSPATDLSALQPDQLTADQVLACDIFLIDLWYEQLHYHTDCIYRRLLQPDQEIHPDENDCLFGRFLSSLETQPGWQRVTSALAPIHAGFHQLTDQMTGLIDGDLTGLQNLYIHESLPLSCRLKNELTKVSLFLRSHLAAQPPALPFLTENFCPITRPGLAAYGPLLRAFNLNQDLCTLIRAQEKNMPDHESIERA